MRGSILPQELYKGAGHPGVDLLPLSGLARPSPAAASVLRVAHVPLYFLYKKTERKHFGPAGVSQ
jgi:hypothetical protein